MTGNAYDTKKDFERCAALRDWRLTHAGAMPRQRSDNAVEGALARWFSKALQRRQRALSDRPSERQLTPDEAVHLNSIVDLAMGQASANAPVSESIDTAAETPAAMGNRPHLSLPGDANMTKKCSMPRCRNNAASHRAKFCTVCFKKNAVRASLKRKVYGGGARIFDNSDNTGISGLTAQADRSASAQAHSTAPRPHGVLVSVADLMTTGAPMPTEVQLQGVRVLSFSKISSVPGRKGKSKNKSKSKGKGKDK